MRKISSKKIPELDSKKPIISGSDKNKRERVESMISDKTLEVSDASDIEEEVVLNTGSMIDEKYNDPTDF